MYPGSPLGAYTMWCTPPPCAQISHVHTPPWYTHSMVHTSHGTYTPPWHTHPPCPHTLHVDTPSQCIHTQWCTPPMCTPSHGAHTLMVHTYPMGTHPLWYISSMVHTPHGTHTPHVPTNPMVQPMCTPPCGVHTPRCTNSPTIHMPPMVHTQRAGLICCENEDCFPAEYERGSWAGRRDWVSLLSYGRSVFFQSRAPGEAGAGRWES